MKVPSILILDDESRLSLEIGEFLENSGHLVLKADRPSVAMNLLEKHSFDIALVDIKLPEYDGLEFLRRLKVINPTVESIVMSGHGDMDSVIEAFRIGAFDYLRKPFTTFELQAALNRTGRYIDVKKSSRKFASLCEELNRQIAGDNGFIGKSAGMQAVRASIIQAAENPNAAVLIQGESGTGKELVARRIHALSSRAAGRFVALNCAAIPRTMFESELFGHQKGAFTDAHDSRAGLFLTADGGTLFLDEIGELSLESQAKLLRAIEDKSIRPVGSDQERIAAPRILCATNADITELVSQNLFRKDLYYRLAVVTIKIPPLRARPDDVNGLALHFLTNFLHSDEDAKTILDEDFIRRLSGHSFPGNVRELRNMMERCMMLKRKPTERELASWMTEIDGPPGVSEDHPDALSDEIGQELPLNLDAAERKTIERALRQTRGNLSAGARLLGISRQALDRRLNRHGIQLT